MEFHIYRRDDGSYELIAGPGKWEITVYRPYDDNVNWVYDGAPKRVKFAAGSKKESKSKNFTVFQHGWRNDYRKNKKLPAGVSAEDLSNYVYIDAFDPEGRGNWDQPKDDGTFEIPLQPGQYELSLWIDPELKGFGSPDIKFVRVGKKTVDIGTLALTSRSKTISGVVKIANSETVLLMFMYGDGVNRVVGYLILPTSMVNILLPSRLVVGKWVLICLRMKMAVYPHILLRHRSV